MFKFCRFNSKNTSLYQQYLMFKARVFATEFGWNISLSDSFPPSALKDSYDDTSIFVGCFCKREMIGVARVSGPKEPKPYSQLYEGYDALGCNFVVVTSVAVTPEYRGKKIATSIEEGVGKVTIGRRIMEEVELLSGELGSEYQFLTAGYGRSEKFFCDLGFTIIRSKYDMDWAPVPLVDCVKPVKLKSKIK
ncbi:hypothetical protein CWC22_010885 [Pseudoalteromonas rubra]|uniref:Acyl-homoserine-lactone synthase n=1 Tax=Pseudoalteromonas rubra TaxID=43658 RepID=A0A5S3UPV4_9GAMM|nr:GNAT family N-acetyltransferase [Pseudoalteromonas rubra]QPB83464.1 hypothetical protein CWC22_010885 [Pseudoalteromonas rubra]